MQASMGSAKPLDIVYALIQIPVFMQPKGTKIMKAKDLQKYPAVQFILESTGVVEMGAQGWKAGEKWDNWKFFLVSEHHRLRHEKPSKSRTQKRPRKAGVQEKVPGLRRAA